MAVKTKFYGSLSYEVFSRAIKTVSSYADDIKSKIITEPDKDQYKTVSESDKKITGGKRFAIEGTQWDDNSISLSFYDKTTQMRYDLGKIMVSKFQDSPSGSTQQPFETTNKIAVVADDLPF